MLAITNTVTTASNLFIMLLNELSRQQKLSTVNKNKYLHYENALKLYNFMLLFSAFAVVLFTKKEKKLSNIHK